VSDGNLLGVFSLDELIDAIEPRLVDLPAEARCQFRIAIEMARTMPRREERREMHAEILRRRNQPN
jgi:hypothetical protein